MRFLVLVPSCAVGYAFSLPAATSRQSTFGSRLLLLALSNRYLENDLVAIAREGKDPRLCAVKPDGLVCPLCVRQDDVETDLFVDPREFNNNFWMSVSDENVCATYGEGFYGQRPVPSLGGGPGYGAEADEIWSVTAETLDQARSDGVSIPVLDVGISHGEKARGGFF